MQKFIRWSLIMYSIVTLLSCTTLNEKKRLLKQQFEAINKQDGIDKDEAMIIARHYMLVKTTIGQIHRLGDELIDKGDHWVVDLFDVGPDPKYIYNYEITRNEITLMISKHDGSVLRKTIPDLERFGFSRAFVRNLVIRHAKIKRSADITLEQANIVAQHYIYIIRHKDLIKYYSVPAPTQGIEIKDNWAFELTPNEADTEPLTLLVSKQGMIITMQSSETENIIRKFKAVDYDDGVELQEAKSILDYYFYKRKMEMNYQRPGMPQEFATYYSYEFKYKNNPRAPSRQYLQIDKIHGVYGL